MRSTRSTNFRRPNSAMRIGLLSTSFPRAEDDLAGSFVRGFASALAARGHAIEVLAPAPSEPIHGEPPAWPGVSVEWVRYAPRAWQRSFYGAGVLDNLRSDPLSALGLAPFVAQLALETRARVQHWDALISHWAVPCALVAGELRGARPHLAVLHSADVFVLERLPRVMGRLLATRIAQNADSLLCSSRDLRARFLALLAPLKRAEVAARAHVSAMGISPVAPLTEYRDALRARLGLDGLTILSLGRLIPIKGIEHAIDALPPDCSLVICGDGPARASMEQRARGKRVRFMGNVFAQRKAELLHASDLFVLPSVRLPNGRTEGMPQAILEAMEHGLPVIASDVGGVSDVVRSGENGVLVSPADVASLREAISALRDPDLRARLSADARATAAEYHWSELAPRIEALLDV